MGVGMGMGDDEIDGLRRAGLVHDLGKVAVPTVIRERAERGVELSEGEWERFRLHPYNTCRALARVDRLGPLGPEGASHHEWVNGQGYPNRLTHQRIPLGGRVLAVADTYAQLSARWEGPKDEKEVLERMRPLVRVRLNEDCYEALVSSLAQRVSPPRRRAISRRAGNLSNRGVEVLRHIAQRMSNCQIAQALVISEKTVEHIYDKLGVTSRASAVVIAVQDGIFQ